jgi:hypothetical protein
MLAGIASKVDWRCVADRTGFHGVHSALVWFMHAGTRLIWSL